MYGSAAIKKIGTYCSKLKKLRALTLSIALDNPSLFPIDPIIKSINKNKTLQEINLILDHKTDPLDLSRFITDSKIWERIKSIRLNTSFKSKQRVLEFQRLFSNAPALSHIAVNLGIWDTETFNFGTLSVSCRALGLSQLS